MPARRRKLGRQMRQRGAEPVGKHGTNVSYGPTACNRRFFLPGKGPRGTAPAFTPCPAGVPPCARCSPLVLSLAATPLAAQEPSLARPQLLLREVVTGMPRGERQEVQVLTASFRPGDRTVFHTHRHPVTVYVLEGAFTLEMEGRAPRRGPRRGGAGGAARSPHDRLQPHRGPRCGW